MTELTLTQILGPRYEIVIQQAEVQVGEDFGLSLSVSEPLRINVGTGFNQGNAPQFTTVDVTITAAQNLNAYRAVGHNGLYTQPTKDSLGQYAGITRMATVTGDPINVVRAGLISEGGWTWTPNAPIFITTDGVLTQTLPTDWVRRIGWAISATQINLDPFPVIGV